MRLALSVGCVDVDGMLSKVSINQFNELLAYDRLEPIGEHRADWRNAQLICWLGRFLAQFVQADCEFDERSFMPFVFPNYKRDVESKEVDPLVLMDKLDSIALKQQAAGW